MSQIILCCGGRKFFDREKVNATLNRVFEHVGFLLSDTAILHGGATGADTLCAEWGQTMGVCVIRVDANWTAHRKRGGPLRNEWMMRFCVPTYGVAFPGGPGTAHMVKLLEGADIPVYKPWGIVL